ncbi:low molecular weight protein-tyrosine-phosphatase [Usitatibacter palustris]|uniref:protein-tyrosine-phosphatase n=1 Tax=Usitatibacter palustris TaxID=2732487 RepID=A0A6M4HAI3_9PROT|nr:low molecular weight protein-tyrosine-phosphatase [Usitatibacter palustris]QJR15683.1 Putative low molecular weight protein-tyrosine-phosphatase [Usitatibacter palustris]
MRSILFVCTANICRSPTAEGVLRKLLAAKGAQGFELASAGTHAARDGMPPFPMAVTAARRRGYDLTRIVSQPLVPDHFDRFDLILAMDRGHQRHMLAIAPTRARGRIEMFLEYSEAFHGEEVGDPYGGNERDYEAALDRIEDGCRGLVKVLVR